MEQVKAPRDEGRREGRVHHPRRMPPLVRRREHAAAQETARRQVIDWRRRSIRRTQAHRNARPLRWIRGHARRARRMRQPVQNQQHREPRQELRADSPNLQRMPTGRRAVHRIHLRRHARVRRRPAPRPVLLRGAPLPTRRRRLRGERAGERGIRHDGPDYRPIAALAGRPSRAPR